VWAARKPAGSEIDRFPAASCMNRDRCDHKHTSTDSDASSPIGKRERTHDHTRVAKTDSETNRAESAAPRCATQARVTYAHTYKALS